MLLLDALCLALISAGLTALMVRYGAIDHPVGRSSHRVPIPKGGGVGIVAATLLGLAVLMGPGVQRLTLGVGGFIVAAMGFYDDRRDFPPLIKLLLQFAAALLPVGLGLVPRLTGVVPLDDAFAIGWVLLVANAVNFMDGLNGLAAGTVAVAAAQAGLPWLTIGLLAGLVGFLPFNYPTAKIFMGDVGSQFCGYAVALLALLGGAGPHPLVVPFALAGLLFDVIFTLLRRALAREPLLRAHRSHLYQIAHRTGVADWAIAALHWGFAAWGVLLGLAPWSPLLVGAVLMPQLLWAGFVVERAQRIPVGRW